MESIKRKLIEACFRELDVRADSLRDAMEEAQQSANEYGLPKDRYDSYRAQLLRKRDMFAQQLQKILEQRTILEKIDPDKKSGRVEFGSMVFTGDQKILVAVGLGRIEVEGEDYFVISPGVPIYKSMEGARKGDRFDFRGHSSEILEVF